ncbi:MAG: branched-chain amino acid ABC transporter permease [Alphaproteobacteria bacterium]
MSERFTVATSTRTSRAALVGMLLLLAGLIAGPWWLGRGDLRLAVEIGTLLALAQMWNLLAGYAGLVSVGQQAFVGLGGYALFVGGVFLGLNPLLCIPLAGLAAALFAIPTAAVVFRLRAAYFAIGTWVVAEVYMLGFAQVSALGGGSGMSLPTDVVRRVAEDAGGRDALIYWSALALAVGATGMVYGLLRSRHGLALTAIRDSEPAAESVGVDNARTRWLVYIAAAFVTGMAGALIFLSKLRISPEAAFNVVDWTAYVIFIVVIGGVGRIEGPIVGTIVFFVLRAFLADLGAIYLIVLGLLAVAVMLVAPQGLWGLLAERAGIELFPVRRRLIVHANGQRERQA